MEKNLSLRHPFYPINVINFVSRVSWKMAHARAQRRQNTEKIISDSTCRSSDEERAIRGRPDSIRVKNSFSSV